MALLAGIRAKGFDDWARDRYRDPLKVILLLEVALWATSWAMSLAFGSSARLINVVLFVATVWAIPFAYLGRRLPFDRDPKLDHEVRQYRIWRGDDVPQHPTWWRQESEQWGGAGRYLFWLIGVAGAISWVPVYLGYLEVFAVFWIASLGAIGLAKHERRKEFQSDIKKLFLDADAARNAFREVMAGLEANLERLKHQQSSVEREIEELIWLRDNKRTDPVYIAAILDQLDRGLERVDRRLVHVDNLTTGEAEESQRRERRSVILQFVLAAASLLVGVVLGAIGRRVGLM